MSRLPRKLKKKVKKELLKQKKIQEALKLVSLACQSAVMAMQAYRLDLQNVNSRLGIINKIVN